MNKKYKSHIEWLKQAEYDLETASAMYKAGKYIYTVFMCHLSVEKALKGVYAKKVEKEPPRTHDLIYLVKVLNLSLPYEHQEFLKTLNDLSVPTRYPDELDKLIKQYKRERTRTLLNQTKELLKWLKERL